MDQVAEVSAQYSAEIKDQTVPAGYKQTEVGVIPADWIVKSLGSITDPNRPISYGIVQTGPSVPNGVRCLRVVDVVGGKINKNNLITTSKSISDSYRRTILKIGDLVIPLRGKVGEIGLIDNELCGSNLTRGIALIALNDGVDSRYLKNYLSSTSSSNRFLASMNGSALQEITIATLRNFKVSIPVSSNEQTAIANALSDVDALISELEKLIAKKQAIKTAAMQQLLTGRTRLPAFALREDGSPKGYKQSELGEIPEDWEAQPFGHALTIRHGKNQQAVENPNGTIPIFATGGQIGWADQYLWNNPSVLIGRKGTIDKPRYSEQPFWTVDTLFYSEIKDCVAPKFIFYKFCMIDWMQYNEASGVPSLNASTIERVLMSLPSKNEQTAIATILSDMDEEIQALEQRLSKTRQIKQGMMQELLTGRTRLV